MQRTPHRIHPENVPKTPSRTPLKDTANTLQPRREGSDRKERWEEGGSEQLRGCGGEGKRENARNRCFDMRVSSIATIHDKIYGLLSLIKRDKPEQPTPKAQGERVALLGKHHLPGYSHPSTKERLEAINAARLHNTQNSINQREGLVTVSTLNRDPASQSQNEYVYKKTFEYAPRNQQRTLTASERGNGQNVVPLRGDKTPVKRSYLPAEYEPRQALTPKAKVQSNQFAEDQIEYMKYEIKIERRKEDNISKPRNAIYESSQRYVQKERNLAQKERTYGQKEKRLQMMENRQVEVNCQTKFERINIQSEKKKENAKKQTHFVFPESIPKPEPSKFKPITLADQSMRSQKLSTTTKLIDEQIKRIKSKIEESESHSQWMNSKLEKQHDRNAISQTYMEEDSEGQSDQ